MSHPIFKNTALLGFLLSVAAAAIAFLMGHGIWGLGILTAACWMFLNLFFLYRLLDMGMHAQKSKHPGRVLVLATLKFPVIYLTGYFILRSRYFPVESLLIGLTLFVLAILLTWAVSRKQIISVVVICLWSICGGLISSSFASEAPAHPSHEAHGGGSALHTTNLIGLISRFLPEDAASILNRYENVFFGVLVILVLTAIFYLASRNIKLVPGRLQMACESVVEGLDGFVCGILGPEGRKYTPFLGTLFLYILTMNLIGLVPLMKSNTANSITLQGPVALPVPTTTVSLALIVFITVQAIGIKKQGLLGYLDHMAGTPRDAFGWILVPLMFPIHVIGEFAKPFSLTFRLFCNTMGGHILVAVFIGMGVASMLIPFQAPFLMFEIATSTIQAFVFTLLSTVYIAMMLPHDDHSHPAEDAAHGAVQTH